MVKTMPNGRPESACYVVPLKVGKVTIGHVRVNASSLKLARKIAEQAVRSEKLGCRWTNGAMFIKLDPEQITTGPAKAAF